MIILPAKGIQSDEGRLFLKFNLYLDYYSIPLRSVNFSICGLNSSQVTRVIYNLPERNYEPYLRGKAGRGATELVSTPGALSGAHCSQAVPFHT